MQIYELTKINIKENNTAFLNTSSFGSCLSAEGRFADRITYNTIIHSLPPQAFQEKKCKYIILCYEEEMNMKQEQKHYSLSFCNGTSENFFK